MDRGSLRTAEVTIRFGYWAAGEVGALVQDDEGALLESTLSPAGTALQPLHRS